MAIILTPVRNAKRGGVDISDADAAVGDVKAGKTFYSVAVPKKTGTMPTVAIAANSDSYPQGYHAGNPGGLDNVETDLSAAKIKSGVNIFAKVGTYTGANPDHDAQGNTTTQATGASASAARDTDSINAGANLTLASNSPTVTAGACMEGYGFCLCLASAASSIKLQLLLDGTQVAESGYVTIAAGTLYGLQGSKENLGVGARTALLRAHNYAGASRSLYHWAEAVFGGAVKKGV